jgi:hypothetical protein
MHVTRRLGVLAVTASLALLTAACGASSGGTSSAGTPSAGGTPTSGAGGGTSAYLTDRLGLARCLRAHGVPNFPDPDSSGQEPADTKQLVSSPQGQAAVGACSYWNDRIHNDVASSVAAKNQATEAEYVRFAHCMRSHGLPNFPDPTLVEGRVEFLLNPGQDGFDPHSPQVLAKARQCESVLPAGSGLPSIEETS